MLKTIHPTAPTCIEICSRAGVQAHGLEVAGFEALAHVENDRHACATLRQNRPGWNVLKKCRVVSGQWSVVSGQWSVGRLETQITQMDADSKNS
jgi:site-specific DNA-cytosine methylase